MHSVDGDAKPRITIPHRMLRRMERVQSKQAVLQRRAGQFQLPSPPYTALTHSFGYYQQYYICLRITQFFLLKSLNYHLLTYRLKINLSRDELVNHQIPVGHATRLCD